jgi:IS1 family transposase/transposase-like protein
MAREKQPKPVHQLTAAQFDRLFQTEHDCIRYLVLRRWPEGIRCPRCGSERVYPVSTKPWHWQCYTCTKESYRFSHLTGTIFENTNKPLKDWFRVIHLMLVSKKGMSALQLYRYMGFGSYKTAWLMCHKVRIALTEDIEQLGGIVEVDETLVGGKAEKRHKDKRGGGKGGGTGIGDKAIVVGAVRRKGNVVARVIGNMKNETLTAFVREAVSHKVSLLCTDQWAGYKKLADEYPLRTVDHSRGQYVAGVVHTQTIEGFWSLIKRGMIGTFHKVSKKYLALYVSEFQFRYNNRENADIFGAAIKGC